MAEERARVTRDVGLVNRIQRAGAWDDIGALKRFLMDELVTERNQLARDVVTDIRDREAEIAAP